MNPKVLIIGGGISGLVANWALKLFGAQPTILEPGRVGGEFTAGGLKYIHKTDAVLEMFQQLCLPHSVYTVRGGMLIRGQMYNYPEALAGFAKPDVARIQADHYRKTRHCEPDQHAAAAMNDPAALGPRRALRCDFQELIRELSDPFWADIQPVGVTKLDVDRGVAFDNKGGRHHFDFVVLTVPLWIIRSMVKFFVPEGAAMKLNVANVTPHRDQYIGFDYVYTPYTPADLVHRFSPLDSGYSVEFNGEMDEERLLSELNFIFPDGYRIENMVTGLKGHLLPLAQKPDWPRNAAPIGRFAKWDPRSTVDVVLDDAKELATRWFS